MHGLPDSLESLKGATIAFDLDGTLVETAPDLVGALNDTLAEAGHPPLPFDQVRLMVGRGAKALLERGFAAAGDPLGPDRAPAMIERFIGVYLARIARESRPFPGVVDALIAMRTAGAKLVVCTNKLTSLSVALLDALDMTRLFDAVVGADLSPAPKPDARHLIAAVDAVGGDLRRTVMVGDAATDVGAARATGVPCLLVSFGYTETAVQDLGAEMIVDHFADVPAGCAALLGPN